MCTSRNRWLTPSVKAAPWCRLPRSTPAPKVPYNPNYFLHDYWFFDYAGSFQCDWAVHHYDIVHWAMGVDRPKTVIALGGMMCFPENNLQYPDTLDAVTTKCRKPWKLEV